MFMFINLREKVEAKTSAEFSSRSENKQQESLPCQFLPTG